MDVMEDQTSRDGAIFPSESNKPLSLSKEIIHRGLDLAAKIDDQNQLAHYQSPIRYFPGILTPSCITFSRNGNVAAIASHWSSKEENNEIIVWNSTTGSVSYLSGLEHGLTNLGYRGNGQIWSLALSSKGDFVLAGYDDGDTLCWDVQKNQIRFRIVGHMFSEPVTKLDFSPDNQWIIRKTEDVLNLYDADNGDYLRRPYIIAGNPVGRLNTMVFMHDGNKIEICGFYHPGRQFEGIQGKERPNPYTNKASEIADIFISNDNKKIASINRNGEVTIWDRSSGEKITHWVHTKGNYHTSDEYLQQQLTHLNRAPKKTSLGKRLLHQCPYKSVAISPDVKRILSSGGDQYMRLWTLDGQNICEYDHKTTVSKVAFLRDGQHAISGCWDGSVYLWRLP